MPRNGFTGRRSLTRRMAGRLPLAAERDPCAAYEDQDPYGEKREREKHRRRFRPSGGRSRQRDGEQADERRGAHGEPALTERERRVERSGERERGPLHVGEDDEAPGRSPAVGARAGELGQR